MPVPQVPPVCLVGLESCGGGVVNNPVRTYWRQRGAELNDQGAAVDGGPYLNGANRMRTECEA